MHPILLKIFNFKLHTYGALMGSGFLVAMQLLIRRAKKIGISEKDTNQCILFAFLGGILGARLLFVMVDHPMSYLRNPIEIIKIWKGGLVFFGGFLLAATFIGIYAHRKSLGVLKIFDACAPTLVIAHALGRLGCFMAGCCYGKACNLPWAVTFTDPGGVGLKNLPLHPTQIYSAIFLLLLFFLLLGIRHVQRFHGTVILTYLIVYPIGRSIIEQLRGDFRGGMLGLSTAQLISIPTVILAAGFMTHLFLKKRAASSA